MAKSINAISQHALDRYIERAGIKFRDVGHAMEKCWSVVRAAKFSRTRDATAIWRAKGWVLLVNDRTVRTMYLSESVQAKKRHIEFNPNVSPQMLSNNASSPCDTDSNVGGARE